MRTSTFWFAVDDIRIHHGLSGVGGSLRLSGRYTESHVFGYRGHLTVVTGTDDAKGSVSFDESRNPVVSIRMAMLAAETKRLTDMIVGAIAAGGGITVLVTASGDQLEVNFDGELNFRDEGTIAIATVEVVYDFQQLLRRTQPSA